MKFIPQQPPRPYTVGRRGQIHILDVGTMELEPDEQITFRLPQGEEYDVARKSWGFYATPSLNGRLEVFGLRCVLIKNKTTKRYFVLLVKAGKETEFKEYCDEEMLEVIAWIDSSKALESLEQKIKPTNI